MGALFLVGMIGLYVAARSYAEAASNRSFDKVLVGSVLSIAETLSVANGVVSVDMPYAALDMLSAAPDDRVFYRVLGPNGQVITGDRELPMPPGFSRSAPTVAIRSNTLEAVEPRFFDAVYSGEVVRFALLGRQVAQAGHNGWLWVQVGHTRRARNQMTNELVLNALAPIAAMTLLALAVVWFGIGGALRPLTRIGDELAVRGANDLSPVTAPAPTEAAPLVDALNEFMARLETNIETLRAFIAEAAHQMRTPLAALLAQAQMAGDGTDEDRKRGLAAVERNGAKLSRLLNQLLSDATVTHRSDVREFEEFDLLRATRLAVKEAVPMASGVEVRVKTSLRSAPYRGDALMIGEAIKNLIHNAFCHGNAAEGGLAVALDLDDDLYVVAVSDRGTGIRAEDRARVFERFSRGSVGVPGAGLGLAIVRQAVSSQGGEVRLRDRKGGGLVVELRLRKPIS